MQFVKRKGTSYTQYQKVVLALRIGYYKEAFRLICGKPSNYIWEGCEDNPLPYWS